MKGLVQLVIVWERIELELSWYEEALAESEDNIMEML